MSRHSKKHIEAALGYAEERSWTVKASAGRGHRWGSMTCPCGDCPIRSIWSTPRSPENHARQLRRFVDRCPGKQED